VSTSSGLKLLVYRVMALKLQSLKMWEKTFTVPREWFGGSSGSPLLSLSLIGSMRYVMGMSDEPVPTNEEVGSAAGKCGRPAVHDFNVK
jgi:hypothetical protein